MHDVGAYITTTKILNSNGTREYQIYAVKACSSLCNKTFDILLQFIHSTNRALKAAKVIPPPKTKDPIGLNKFRPISRLPVLSKPLETRIHKLLMLCIEDHNLFHPFQSGFRRHRSCHSMVHGFPQSTRPK